MIYLGFHLRDAAWEQWRCRVGTLAVAPQTRKTGCRADILASLR